MHNKYLQIAQHDLKASVCLYKNGLYPQALFYFQQSTEKTAKAFAYRYGLSDADVKQASHSPIKIFKSILKCVTIKFGIPLNLFLDSQLDQISDKYKRLSDQKVSESMLKGLVELVNGNLHFPLDMNDDDAINSLVEEVKKHSGEHPISKDLNSELLKYAYIQIMHADNEGLRDYIKMSICNSLLVFKLNLVSNRLVSNVRYLNSSEDVIPELKYTLVHPLVSILPQMADALRHAHQHLPLILNTESVK